jgi:heme/copper-type cytochrome/quinol oxidase subunit 2
MNYEFVIKVGAVIASIGTILLVIFATVLLVFPITKSCDNESKCIYISNAPYPLNSMIAPIVLVIILLIISGGIAMIRLGKWSLNREKLYDKQ